MPITKTGRYSMNPAYGEALDRAAQENGDGQCPDGQDGQDNGRDAGEVNGKDGAKDAQKKAAVRRIEIEPAENGGFVSHTHREQTDNDEDGGQADGWAPPYHEPELRAHPDSAHLMRFLARELEN